MGSVAVLEFGTGQQHLAPGGPSIGRIGRGRRGGHSGEKTHGAGLLGRIGVGSIGSAYINIKISLHLASISMLIIGITWRQHVSRMNIYQIKYVNYFH
mgnify:CR=1 FL=1